MTSSKEKTQSKNKSKEKAQEFAQAENLTAEHEHFSRGQHWPQDRETWREFERSQRRGRGGRMKQRDERDERGERDERAERGGRGERGERGARGDRGERDGRGDRGGRHERGDRRDGMGRGRPGGPGGPRGRGGRRQRRGDVRGALLLLIADQPRHGYELMQAIGDRTAGQWQPSPGSIYPALAALQDEGMVRLEADDSNRGVAHLTEAGQEYVDAHKADLEAIWDSVRGSDTRQLFHATRGIDSAARQVGHVGSPEQVAAAMDLLVKTQRQLYAILATDPAQLAEPVNQAQADPKEN